MSFLRVQEELGLTGVMEEMIAHISSAQGCTFYPPSAAPGELLRLLGYIQPDPVSGNPECLRQLLELI